MEAFEVCIVVLPIILNSLEQTDRGEFFHKAISFEMKTLDEFTQRRELFSTFVLIQPEEMACQVPHDKIEQVLIIGLDSCLLKRRTCFKNQWYNLLFPDHGFCPSAPSR